MIYLLLWLFGFTAYLVNEYYRGDLTEYSLDVDYVVVWLRSIIWPVSLIHDTLTKIRYRGTCGE